MPITTRRIPPLAVVVVALALIAGPVASAAAGKFTVVIGGKISSVESIDGQGGKLVHARAVAEMARAAGWGLSLDAGSGVVSLARGGGDVEASFSGFKTGATFVVDGKIVKVSSKASGGAPYVAAKDVKKIAELMGFSADLDGTVLALTPSSSGGGSSIASSGGGGSGVPNDDFMSLVQNAAGGTGLTGGGSSGVSSAPAHDGSVCGYLDSQKILWLATEPSQTEKDVFNRLAALWSKKDSKGNIVTSNNPEDLKLFERTLKGFHQKVRTRLDGTKNSSPPSGAQPFYDTSVPFLEKVDEILVLSFDMIRVYKLPKDKQEKEVEQLKKNIEKIKKLDTEQKALGTTQVETIHSVREQHGCGPA